jgi:catechol 2,3-dioxygenase-like lactoylglutathione lyase family enzyme
MKTHVNLTTSDLSKSVMFYSTLLDAKPKKILDDYALFVTDEPPLELALDLAASVAPTRDMHFGIFVESVEEVERAIERLTIEGLVSSVEREETCCYASQSKVWTTDPEGRRWEIYTVHKETQDRKAAESSCCASTGEGQSCCAT